MNNKLNTTYKALMISESGMAKIETLDSPILNDDEVIVESKFWGICGSDLKLFNGEYTLPHKNNLIPGHEWIGYITEIGRNVKEFSIGERVTGECSVFCNQCFFCKEVNKNLCKNILKHGISTDGFASDKAIVHKRYLHSLKSADFKDELGIFIEPLAVVLQGLKQIKTNFSILHNVLILGAGTIGLLAGLALKSKNEQLSVHIVDINEKRLKISEKYGLIPIHCQLNEIKNYIGKKSFDLLIESSGFDGYLDIIKKYIRSGGEILLFAMNPNVKIPVEFIVRDMIKFHGNLGGAGSFPDAIQLLLKNNNNINSLIDKIINFNQLPEIINNKIETLYSGVKTVIRM